MVRDLVDHLLDTSLAAIVAFLIYQKQYAGAAGCSLLGILQAIRS
jgi:hypothetical protein